jgi:hypothetical protein
MRGIYFKAWYEIIYLDNQQGNYLDSLASLVILECHLFRVYLEIMKNL